jgi:signal transduction histidine kinase
VFWGPVGPVIAFQYPIAGSRDTLVGVVALSPLRASFQASRARGSGETYLLDDRGRMLTGSRFVTNPTGREVVDTEGRRAAAAGRQGVAEYLDYRRVPVVGAYAPVRFPAGIQLPARWVILSEVDVAEAMAPVRTLVSFVAAFALGVAALTIVSIALTARRIARPLRALDEAAAGIATGHLDRRVRSQADDEFGRVSATFNAMADRLQEQVLSLQALTDRLQNLDRLKNDYIHAISHDLRTPITVIQGYMEMLDDAVEDRPGAPLHEYLRHIERATTRLTQMVDDLLDAARLEAGTFHLDLEDVDLGAHLRAFAQSLEPAARDARLRLQVDVSAAPGAIRADAERVDRVVANLVSNAFKFTPPGGEVVIRACTSDGDVRCEVSDTGEGIAPADLPLLFRRFSQLSSGQAKKGSTGLGLSICKAIVEAHGGRIGVESAPGRGSTFWFTLPRDPEGAR